MAKLSVKVEATAAEEVFGRVWAGIAVFLTSSWLRRRSGWSVWVVRRKAGTERMVSGCEMSDASRSDVMRSTIRSFCKRNESHCIFNIT